MSIKSVVKQLGKALVAAVTIAIVAAPESPLQVNR